MFAQLILYRKIKHNLGSLLNSSSLEGLILSDQLLFITGKDIKECQPNTLRNLINSQRSQLRVQATQLGTSTWWRY
jgi:hypothetical protein